MIALGFDLGASNGRAVIGRFNGSKLQLQEIHRFPNDPVRVGNHLYWDILRLFHEIKQGIMRAKQEGYRNLGSMGIDSWAVDFGLVDKNGELLGNPYHYRDPQTAGLIGEVCRIIPRREIFARTGIQFIPINTVYHLFAMKKSGSPILEQADRLLMIPDLIRFFLTGERHGEFTNATTTQLFNSRLRQWDERIIGALGLPKQIFGDVVEPGTTAGTLRPSVCGELGVSPVPVVAVAEHDTASAVVAVPSDRDHFAYLSCGTWSLLGTEVTEPVLTDEALDWNFTNEGGFGRTFRLLKNIMGLWIIQECRRIWAKEGENLSYGEMTELAKQAKPFVSFIDPDHEMFFNPAHMPGQIRKYCRDTRQPVPETKGEILNCVFSSLAMKYRLILERTEKLSKRRFPGLHMVGGGIQNELLCQYTANAIARPVWAGPVEATAVGNLLIQYLALGQIRSVKEAREIVRMSFPVKTYEPQDVEVWEEAYAKFRHVTGC